MPGRLSRNPKRRRWRRGIRWGIGIFLLLLVLEYLVLPELGGARKSLNLIGKVNVAYVVAGVLLEAAALVAYAQLTRTLLPSKNPSRFRLLQINMSSLALSHVTPGGTAPGAVLAYRLLTQNDVSGPDAGFAIAMQGVGSAVVLNVIFWLALVISLFFHGFKNPLYAVAAGAGILMMGIFATVVVLLTRGRTRSVEVVRSLAGRVPFLEADRLAEAVQRIAERLKTFASDRDLLYRAVSWAAANWLLDAASLWVFIAAFNKLVSPIDLLVAYGLANVLAVIPITPSGLGVVEGVLIPTLVGFQVPKTVAVLGVLGYRAVNFWLPIPVGGASYLSLRFTSQGWRERMRSAHGEIIEQPTNPDDQVGGDSGSGPEPEKGPSEDSKVGSGAISGNTKHRSNGRPKLFARLRDDTNRGHQAV
jgi:uncharacterized protein (TIRG00374 family)